MAFDDLARHMASRDGKKKAIVAPDQILTAAAEADRRQTRQRQLILGAVLLAGGVAMLVLFALYIWDAENPHPSRLRPPETRSTYLVPVGLVGASAIAVVTGATQLWRGIRGRG